MRTPCNLRGARNQKGGALLTVLWLSAALAAIAFSVATSVRAETDRVSSASNGLRAWYLATGSVERAMQWMIWGGDYRNPNGTPRFWDWNQPQPQIRMSYPSGDVVVEMIPESSKMSINFASPDDLLRVVTAVTGDAQRARQIVDGILDWRSPAASPTAFDQYYFSINPTFRARHASFEEIEELLLVRGVTPELFYGNYIPDEAGRLYASGGLRDCFSVWGSAGPFDVNTANPALMEAVGVPPPGVAAIVARRQIQPFRNLGEAQQLGFPLPRMTTGGIVIWTLRATARLRRPDGSPSEVVRTASAVIKLLDRRSYPANPLHVLRWYDDAWSQSALAPPLVTLPPAGAPFLPPAGAPSP
jgi:general secretion pathway protein K